MLKIWNPTFFYVGGGGGGGGGCGGGGGGGGGRRGGFQRNRNCVDEVTHNLHPDIGLNTDH